MAKPLHTPLVDAFAKAPTLVVGVYGGAVLKDGVKPHLAGEFNFDVERVLHGTGVPLGPVILGRGAGAPDVVAGTRVVALLGSDLTFEFVGVPLLDDVALDGNVFLMRGFYDYNAHLVSPGLVSLKQLQALAKGSKTLDYRIRGKLHGLTDDGTKLVPFGPVVEVEGTFSGYQVKDTAVRGLVVANLPAPTLRITAGFGRHVSVIYRNGWARPLVLGADVTGVDRDGVLLVRLTVTMPDVLTVADIKRYLADPSASHPQYAYSVTLATGEVWTYGDKDYTSTTSLKRPGLSSLRPLSLSLAPERALRFKGLTLNLAPQVGKNLLPDGVDRQLRQELLRGPVACVIAGGPRAETGCVIRLESRRIVQMPAP